MKERFIGKCPVCGLSGCFLTETKTGKEYSYFSSLCQHRGFIPVADVTLFQLGEVSNESVRPESSQPIIERAITDISGVDAPKKDNIYKETKKWLTK